MENNRNARRLPKRPVMSNATLGIGGIGLYCVPSCPECDEPTYSMPECPFCGQPFIYDDAEESDAVLFGLPDAIVCPHCGENATINLHTEQGELIDYFYECSCGGMFEDTKGEVNVYPTFAENAESIKIVRLVKTSEVE